MIAVITGKYSYILFTDKTEAILFYLQNKESFPLENRTLWNVDILL